MGLFRNIQTSRKALYEDLVKSDTPTNKFGLTKDNLKGRKFSLLFFVCLYKNYSFTHTTYTLLHKELLVDTMITSAVTIF